jgi:Ni,Fe-hydrogenase maturation factor
MVVYDRLKSFDLEGIEIVEGGVGGISLLNYFEDDARILIVDYAANRDKKVLDKKDIEKLKIDRYDHSTAFLFLLKTVDKEYKIYCCNEMYNKNEIDLYIEDILKLAGELM